jgi:hypothetical protein
LWPAGQEMESPIEFRWSSGSGAETTQKIQGSTGFFLKRKNGPGKTEGSYSGHRGFLFRRYRGF